MAEMKKRLKRLQRGAQCRGQNKIILNWIY